MICQKLFSFYLKRKQEFIAEPLLSLFKERLFLKLSFNNPAGKRTLTCNNLDQVDSCRFIR